MSAVSLNLGGASVLIDEADVSLVPNVDWFIDRDGYATAKIESGPRLRLVRLHSIILGRGVSLIDHRNGNKLDNRRCNFRTATKSQNAQNAKPKSVLDKTSIFKGVYWYHSRSKWRAQIKLADRRKHLGYFDAEQDAAAAYDKAALRYFGEFARPNLLCQPTPP